MINIVLAYDDNDLDLGEYFDESYSSTVEVFESHADVDCHAITGLQCCHDNITAAVQARNAQNFIFIGYSHGDDLGTHLLTSNEMFVSDVNIVHFCNSLFYTTACSAGLILGPELIKNSCHCFVGYLSPSYATYEEQYSIYIACETFALHEFIRTTKTIGECYLNMQEYFDSQVILLEQKNDILAAMELEGNRYSLTILGNQNLTRNHFQT